MKKNKIYQYNILDAKKIKTKYLFVIGLFVTYIFERIFVGFLHFKLVNQLYRIFGNLLTDVLLIIIFRF